jgi:hypothetical protein
LAARNEPTDALALWASEIKREGVDIRFARADIGNAEEAARIVDASALGLPPLRGVIHAAGIFEACLMKDLTPHQMARIVKPKAIGAWNLHRSTRHLELDFFVLFSSIASVFGQPGDGAYAPASAYVDALARHRRSKGLPATSVCWGAWEGVGMAAAGIDRGLEQYSSEGIDSLSPALALQLLRKALGGPANLVAAPIDRGGTGETPFSLLRPSAIGLLTPHDDPDALLRALRAEVGSAGEARARLTRFETLLMEELSEVLRIDAHRIDRQVPMGRLGLDSLLALEFCRKLRARFGLAVPVTWVFNYPTIADLTGHLADTFDIGTGAPEARAIGRVDNDCPVATGTFDIAAISEEEAVMALLGEKNKLR